MERAEFSRRILEIGGTYADVNRLEEEGRQSAEDAHRDLWESGEMPEIANNSEFEEFCYNAGRDFVWQNMDGLFQLEHPENAAEQRKINRWAYLMRNIGNIGLCLSHYASANEACDDGVLNWGIIGSAEHLLAELREIVDQCPDIDVKEV